MKQIIIDCAKLSSRDGFHAHIARELDFPDYYGGNLDALHDLLSAESNELTLRVINAGQIVDRLGKYGASILAVLRDSAEENSRLTVEIFEDDAGSTSVNVAHGMDALTDCYTLSNGVQIPCVGFGTWQSPSGELAYNAVRAALECGYRHVDTAAAYGNEQSVGDAIRDSGVPRKDIFLTTKLGNRQHGYEDTLAAFNESISKLGTDYVDMYLIHWPNPIKYRDCWLEANAGTWRAFEELYKAGKIRAIGVSNFLPHHIDALMQTANIAPMVNQVKLCPGGVQPIVAPYCESAGILLEAYSPLGTGKIFDVPEMRALAEKYDRTVAQVCIRWSLQNGWLPLPKSVTPERIRENTRVFDFDISADDMRVIANLKDCCGEPRDPDNTPF